MLLACPNCHATFRVPAQALGEQGRSVRCSSCHGDWFAEPRDLLPEELPQMEEAVNEAFSSAVEEDVSEVNIEDVTISVPVPPQAIRRVSKMQIGMLACVLLIFIGLFAVTRRLPLPGLTPMEGLALSNVQLKTDKFGKKNLYSVSGDVVNTTEKQIALSPLRIRLVNAEGELLLSHTIDPSKEKLSDELRILKPGERRPFSANKLAVRNKEAAEVLVDIGSGLDLMLRK